MIKIVPLLFLLLSSAPAFAQADADSGCFTQLQQKCQKCHYLQRVCRQVGERGEKKWQATLDRMVKRRGAELNETEQKSLLNCLATPDPAVVKGCEKE